MNSGDVFPASVTEITPEWLTEVLRASSALQSGRVTSVEHAPVRGGVALMSHMLRLLVTYGRDADSGPDTLIAKFPPIDEDSHRRGIDFGFFEGETGFYGHLATRSAVRVPRCYFSQFDAGTGKFLLLLEDLSAARLGDVSAGCTEAEATTGIEMLGRLHSSWWKSESLADYSWLCQFENRLETILALLPEAWPPFASRFQGILEAPEIEALQKVCEQFNSARRIRRGVSRTLLHGDFKLDNLFFLPAGEMVVCDWGLVMTGPPLVDVAFFVSLNLPVELRRRLDRHLIRAYLAVLHSAGFPDYDFETAIADFKPQLVNLLPRLVAAGGLAEFADQEALEEYALGIRRVLTTIADHGGLDDSLWEQSPPT